MRISLGYFLFVLHFEIFFNGAVAQPQGSVCDGGEYISTHLYYTIRFATYCDVKYTDSNTAPAILRTSFDDCAEACVAQGITCGGFAFDQSAFDGTPNCYLDNPSIQTAQYVSSFDNNQFDSGLVENSSIPLTTRTCGSDQESGVYTTMLYQCNQFIGNDSSNLLDTVFASQLTYCIDHCTSFTNSNGDTCVAVTWDPYLLHGYQNCRLLGDGYDVPIVNSGWDSAVLVNREGQPGFNTTSPSSTTPGTSNPTEGPIDYGPSHPHLDSASIAGIVLGVLGSLIIVVSLVIIARRRQRNRRSKVFKPEEGRNEAARAQPPAAAPVPTSAPSAPVPSSRSLADNGQRLPPFIGLPTLVDEKFDIPIMSGALGSKSATTSSIEVHDDDETHSGRVSSLSHVSEEKEDDDIGAEKPVNAPTTVGSYVGDNSLLESETKGEAEPAIKPEAEKKEVEEEKEVEERGNAGSDLTTISAPFSYHLSSTLPPKQ